MDQKTIIFASSLAAALVFSWLFVWPQMQNIEELRGIVQEERKMLEELANAEAEVSSAIKLKENIERRDGSLIKLAVPSDPERVEATILLNKLAEDSGLTVESVNVSGSGGSGESTIAPVGTTMELSGSYSSIKRLADRLENTLRIFNATALNIQAPDFSGGEQETVISQDQIEFNVEVKGNVFHAPK